MDAYNFNRTSLKRKLLNFIPFSFFDAIFIHFSLYSISDAYISKYISNKIRKFNGLKIQTIRDEYRYINSFADKMAYHGIDILFSVLRPEHIERVYYHDQLKSMYKVATLPGVAPEHMIELEVPPIKDRKIHVSYRSNSVEDLSALVGSFGLEKIELGPKFLSAVNGIGLNLDIKNGAENRIYGNSWVDFHIKSKAVLSAPGGSSLFDFTGDAARSVEFYMEQNPTASPYEVIKNSLFEYDGNIVHKQITPRTFEAIALRTALIMPRDDYRGVIKPWRHYIPIEEGFSNRNEILECIYNDEFLQKMVDRTYKEILIDGGHTRAVFVHKFDHALDTICPHVLKEQKKQMRFK
jgi:hypothetical protein